MKFSAIKSLAYIIVISLLAFDASAVGLQEYLQNSDSETITQVTTPIAATANPTNNQLTYIIELIVAGIVASALIISVLVLLLGKWLAARDKKLIKEIRVEAEQDKDNIISAAATIREQEKETTKLVHDMRNQATEFSTQHEVTEKFNSELVGTAEKVKEKEQELNQLSNTVSERMDEIQLYWEDQLKETVSTILKVQENLDNSLNSVDSDLGKIEEQKVLSQELLQEFLDKHKEQNSTLDKNSVLTQKVNENLEKAHKESKQLLKTLEKHQKNAEQSLKNYSDKLKNFEEQAYEQFDTSFQVADLARQELTANTEESRKHIETMRRQEEQSHGINSQTMKNLESLDYSKIVKISNTLDTTQDMFDEIHNKVEETRHMLDELKEIETDIRETASNVENAVKEQEQDVVTEEVEEILEEVAELEEESQETPFTEVAEQQDNTTIAITDYKMASGDSTPLSFFRNIKQKEK